MIKFGEVPESIKDNDSKNYLEIKPVESMSKQEIDDFITQEFDNAYDETEIDLYDQLLTAVFNRNESELNIDFNIDDKITNILEKFHIEDWTEMNETDQLSAIKELAQTVSDKLGLEKTPDISVFNENDGAYGYYNQGTNKIELNSKFFDDPKEVVNTITHELRHAYQHMRSEIQETMEDFLYKVNFDNYISPLPLPAGGYLFFTDYQDQYVEVDARAFADKFMEVM